ncbi:C-type lectin superfamily 17 member A, partial [Mytilus galloprovincialis]
TLTCPAGWNSFGLKCYKISHQPLTFWNASEYCNNQNADVIMPRTAEEVNTMQTLVGQINSTKSWHGIWIGLTDIESEGTWFWNDGTKLNSTNELWNTETNEPNGFRTENCAIGHKWTENYKWTDVSCNADNRVVCQLK